MLIYLIRHGIAADRSEYTNDEDRPLTEQGSKKTEKIAQRIYEIGVRFDLIITSPLVRARQTADILNKVDLGSKVEERNYLAPNGDIQGWINWYLQLEERDKIKNIALVGHQPDLGNWGEMLFSGKMTEKIILKKAGIIGLKLPEKGNPLGNSELFLLTSPKWLI